MEPVSLNLQQKLAEVIRLQLETRADIEVMGTKMVAMAECLHEFWRNSLVIESAVRRSEGENADTYKAVLAAILKTQEFYKSRGN